MDFAEDEAVDETKERDAKNLTHFDVIGLPADRALVRAVARRLAEPDAKNFRARLSENLEETAPRPKGHVLAALRRSPLVGEQIEFLRENPAPRDF